MNNMVRYDLPKSLPVISKKKENLKSATLEFHLHESIVTIPGQFFMLWLPNDDEIPISISKRQKRHLFFTICDLGPTSKNMVNINPGTLIGLRGPFGNGFKLTKKKTVLLIGGGMGMTPLRYLLTKMCLKTDKKVILIYGAKTGDELLFKEELDKLPLTRLIYCTEDGSEGYTGYPTDKMNDFLTRNPFDQSTIEIYACGPELMLKKVLEISELFDLSPVTQVNLADRYIKCGFGICGSCVLDADGLSICRDGPVFQGDILAKVTDFGIFGRKANGSKHTFESKSH